MDESAGSGNEVRNGRQRPEVPVCIVDRGGRHVDLNAAYAHLAGKTRDALLGSDLLEAWRQDALAEAWHALWSHGRADRLELDRGPRRYEVELTRGEALATLIFRDITEAGEPRTDERTRELLAQVTSASRAKDEFLAMLGHELRNPLAPIATAIERLQRLGVTGPEVRTLARQVQHITRLVDDLLDVARIARGELAIEHKPVDLKQVVARAAEMVAMLVEQKQHRLAIHLPQVAPIVEGDAARLCQAVSNLLMNAAKYTDPGGQIELDLRDDGQHVFIHVRDTGRGMGPEELESVFEPFFRGPAAREGKTSGLGVGLAIVRNLVRLHAGQVTARSDGVGRGSELVLSLPIARDVMVADPVTPTTISGASSKVLVVDDHVDAAGLMGLLLSDHGHVVHVEYSARDALAAADRVRPEIAFLDIGLPDMDGHELARELRTRFGQAIVLVALTGFGREHDRAATEAAGFDAHLVKPVPGRLILETIAKLRR